VVSFLNRYSRYSWPGGEPPRWPEEELPPWREEDRPPLVAVVLAYPGRAIGVAIFSAFFGTITACFVLYGISRLFHVMIWGAAAIPIFVVTIGLLWWYFMDGWNRGLWSFGGDE
jgi:hypothetical protein